MKINDLINHEGSFLSLELIPVPHVIYKQNLAVSIEAYGLIQVLLVFKVSLAKFLS